jgi:PAS domain S-box-containing protein
MKLRSHLVLLVIATVVPVVVLAAALIVYNARLERESVERGMRDTAHTLAVALDLEIRDIATAVQTLAASRNLDPPGDLRRFHDEATSVARSVGGWAVLSDLSGRQVLNTSRPFGAPLPVPTAQSLVMMQRVAEARRPFVSNVFIGTVSRRPAVIVAVPVVRQDRVLYVLDFPFEPARFTSLLEALALSPGSIAIITDREGGVVARVPDAARFVGQPGPRFWVEHTARAAEGFLKGPSLTGVPVYAAFARSRESGWVAGVEAPVATIEASLRRSLLALTAGGVLLVTIASAIALVLGKRIAGPIVALADSLKVEPGVRPDAANGSPVREVQELQRALADATVLARSEARYRSLVSATTSVVWTTDAAGAVAVRQPSWEALTGQGWEDYRGWGWAQALHPGDRDRVKARWAEAVAGGTLFEGEGRIRQAARGQYRRFVARGAPVLNADGSIREWICTLSDVHEQREMEAALRRQASLLDQTHDSVFVWDQGGGIVFWNRGAEELYGWPRAEALGRLPGDLLATRYPGGRDELTATLDRTGAWSGELEQTARDRRRVVVESRLVRVREADGSTLVLETDRDIGDRKRMEEARALLLLREQEARERAENRADREEVARGEAEAANRAKDDFLAVLSHELRTPLSAMVGWVRLLKGGRLDAAQTAHALSVVERNVAHQGRLITDLLDVSRIVMGTLKLEEQVVDFPALVGSVVDSVEPVAGAQGVRLTARLDPDAGPVRGDPERLRQVIENVLANAVKFTPGGGLVSVRLARAGGARLTVSDTGRGIDPGFLPHVFDRFRQADSTSTRAQAGLGLGLAIVRHLVELHGGRVAADSPGEGLGSTFTIDLPLAAAADRPAVSVDGDGSAPPAPDALAGVRVLIVEDDADSRDLFAAVLAQHGGVPAVAATAREGLAMARRLRPDVLVCDIAMPGDDGFSVIREVRSWPAAEGGRLPAVALTAYARPEDRDRTLAAGFDLHLAKPVEPSDFVRAVGHLAGRAAVPSPRDP